MLQGQDLRKNVFIFILSVTMVSLIFSKYVMSMSLIGLLLMIIFTDDGNDNIRIGFNKSLLQWSSYRNWWPFGGFILYFLWIVISLLWSSSHVDLWLHDVQSKLSIIGVGFAFLFIPRLTPKDIFTLHVIHYIALIIACCLVLVVYIPQYSEITLLIGSGRPIPTPIDHVRFSIMIAYGCLSSLAFCAHIFSRDDLHQKYKIGLLILSAVFFAMCHVLAVRSGLLLLYSGLAIFILFYVIVNRKVVLGITGLLLLVSVPIIAFFTIPSFKNKVLYTKYDIERSFQNKGANYSDGDRIRSIRNGIEIWKKQILLGHGAGDYKLVVEKFYQEQDQAGRVLLPHNQWVRTGMAYGIIGILFLLSGFLSVLWRKKARSNLLLIMILQLFFLSLLVESNMERYYALVLFLVFMGLASRLSGPFNLSSGNTNSQKFG